MGLHSYENHFYCIYPKTNTPESIGQLTVQNVVVKKSLPPFFRKKVLASFFLEINFLAVLYSHKPGSPSYLISQGPEHRQGSEIFSEKRGEEFFRNIKANSI